MTIKTIKIMRVVRKEVFAGAVHVTDANIKAVADWCKGEIRTDPDTKKPYIKVRVQHPLNARQTKAYSGDWVLQRDNGFKTYPDEAFKNNFQFVNHKQGEQASGGMIEESKKVRYARNKPVVKKDTPEYPNGKCFECGYGLTEDKTCNNSLCESTHDY